MLAALFRLIWLVPSTAAGEDVTVIPDIRIRCIIPFPKPLQGSERCQRWINACSRGNFTINEITINTCICALRWPGQSLKANFTAHEVFKASRPKRKAPHPS